LYLRNHHNLPTQGWMTLHRPRSEVFCRATPWRSLSRCASSSSSTRTESSQSGSGSQRKSARDLDREKSQQEVWLWWKCGFWIAFLLWLYRLAAQVRKVDEDGLENLDSTKRKITNGEKLSETELQDFWRSCQKGVEWREWKRYVTLESWLMARWEAYDSGVDVDDVLQDWLGMKTNTVPSRGPSEEVSTTGLRRWAMQRDNDIIKDVVAKTKRDEAPMRQQREQQKKKAADHGQNCCKSGSCQPCELEKPGAATFLPQPRCHDCRAPVMEKRDQAFDSSYPPFGLFLLLILFVFGVQRSSVGTR